jgi:hypothetical protein
MLSNQRFNSPILCVSLLILISFLNCYDTFLIELLPFQHTSTCKRSSISICVSELHQVKQTVSSCFQRRVSSSRVICSTTNGNQPEQKPEIGAAEKEAQTAKAQAEAKEVQTADARFEAAEKEAQTAKAPFEAADKEGQKEIQTAKARYEAAEKEANARAEAAEKKAEAAVEAKEEANARAEAATKEAKEANARTEAAEKKAEAAEKKLLISTGQRVACIGDLQSSSMKIVQGFLSDFINEIFGNDRSRTVPYQYLPKAEYLPIDSADSSTPTDSKRRGPSIPMKATRNSGGLVGCKRDIFFNPAGPGLSAEMAHIIPFAQLCDENYWEKVSKFRLGIPFMDKCSASMQVIFDMWREGWGTGKQRVIHSGYLVSPQNYIYLTQQSFYLDTDPSIMLIPLVSSENDYWRWSGEGKKFLVICSSPEVYIAIKATTLTGEDSFISCQDPRVHQAFQAFNQMLGTAVGVVCTGPEDLSNEISNPGIWHEFRKAIKKRGEFQGVKVPDNLQGEFLQIQLGDAKIASAGEICTWTESELHPTPDLVFVALRAFNSWSTSLGKASKLDAFSGQKLNSCKLFPSCIDQQGIISCNFCIASSLLHCHSSFLSPQERDYLYSILTHESAGDDMKCRELYRKHGS